MNFGTKLKLPGFCVLRHYPFQIWFLRLHKGFIRFCMLAQMHPSVSLRVHSRHLLNCLKRKLEGSFSMTLASCRFSSLLRSQTPTHKNCRLYRSRILGSIPAFVRPVFVRGILVFLQMCFCIFVCMLIKIGLWAHPTIRVSICSPLATA